MYILWSKIIFYRYKVKMDNLTKHKSYKESDDNIESGECL